MKTKHGLLFGFAVLLVAAIFTLSLAGCDNGSTDPEAPGNGDLSLSGSIIISLTSGGTVVTTATTNTALYAVYSGGTEDVTYQWKKGGTNVSGDGTGISYTPTEAGSYTVTVSADGYQSKTSGAVAVSVSTDPALSGPIIISATSSGTTAVTTAETGDDLYARYRGTDAYNTTYQWNKDGAAIDDGTNWRYTPAQPGSYTVTVSASGYQSITSDPCVVSASIWTAVENTRFGTSSSASIRGIAYGGGTFVAVGVQSNTTNMWGDAAYSTDGGVTWTSSENASTFYGIAYGDSKFVTVGTLAYSTNGAAWTRVTDTPYGTTSGDAIAYGSGKFVAVGNVGRMAYSEDGVTWRGVTDTTFGTSPIQGIAYGGGKFVAVGNRGKAAYSTDGENWTAVANTPFGTAELDTINAIAYGGGKFVAGGRYGKMAYSTDGGVTWTAITDTPFDDSSSDYIYGIAYGDDTFVAVGSGGKAAYSADGVTWTAVANIRFGSSDIRGIAYGDGTFVAVGRNGKISYSNNVRGN